MPNTYSSKKDWYEKDCSKTVIQQSKQLIQQGTIKIKKQNLETEKPFKGLKINDNSRKKVLDTKFIPISKNPITGAEENALMRDQREDEDFSRKLYTVYTLTNGFKDFSYFEV